MIYINGRGCVSAQRTFDGSFPDEVIVPEGYIWPIVAPPYKEYISPAMIRRMGSGVKNGVVASALALREAGLAADGSSETGAPAAGVQKASLAAAGVSAANPSETGSPKAGEPEPDAIITGTGVGCIKDSESFLTAILENGEAFLTPTAFIQSTHNTVGAQIALGLGCKAYNFSYVNGAISFESALTDARLQLLSGEARNILVGGVDEKADFTYRLFSLAGLIKTGESSPGASYSEGAAFFVLSTEKKPQSYAVLKDVAVINRLEPEEMTPALERFLERTGTTLADIDAVVIGKNDDIGFQEYYPGLLSGFSPEIPVIHYKHLSGEYNTASAFGFWLAAGILKNQRIPEAVLLSRKLRPAIRGAAYRNILLYNQYRGIDHSFILLSGC